MGVRNKVSHGRGATGCRKTADDKQMEGTDMKKKVLCLFMAATMLLGLTACGGGSDSENSSKENAVSTENTADGSSEKTKITVYLGGDAADENQKIVDIYNEQSETTEVDLVTLNEGSSGYEMLTVLQVDPPIG